MTTFTLPAAVAQRLADKRADKRAIIDTVDIRQWAEYKQSHPGFEFIFQGKFDAGAPLWTMTPSTPTPTHPSAPPAASFTGQDIAGFAQAAPAPDVATQSTETSPMPSPPTTTTTADAPGNQPSARLL